MISQGWKNWTKSEHFIDFYKNSLFFIYKKHYFLTISFVFSTRWTNQLTIYSNTPYCPVQSLFPIFAGQQITVLLLI
jgi:hypothetical protein